MLSSLCLHLPGAGLTILWTTMLGIFVYCAILNSCPHVFMAVLFWLKLSLQPYPHIIQSFMHKQCLSMHGQPVYGGSPVVPILGSPRCLCYCHTQGSTVFLSIQHLLGLPLCFIPCTPPSGVICRYLPSFILVMWPKYLKHCCRIL